ncbi:uncharacterized protein PV09_06942 [Verruconis gallopava]|uniref:Uncharacterized protein n=1 Tax=Verruconis gallopava TaxID=253628 RepID=A0A0D2A5F2_9PEZI|nr:uncharacterized protein PV09_06942 [Verruconis gallopava]KIW01770.1 hypothetical protein PV09_06942 [Verruconis gallopava]
MGENRGADGKHVTVLDALDHNAGDGSIQPLQEMTGIRWEMLERRPLTFVHEKVHRGTYTWLYLTDSLILDARFERCVMYNVHMVQCTLRNCHVHFSGVFELKGCVFIDCVLTTDSGDFVPGEFTGTGEDKGSSVLFTHGVVLSNCTVRGNFSQERGRAHLNMQAPYPRPTQLAPYEVHNNVVLKDCVVDCLRRWVWRHRHSIKRVNKHQRLFKFFPKTLLAKTSKRQYSRSNWTAKAAGKQPMYVNDAYDEIEQLDLPRRRCEWDVDRAGESIAHLTRKRKMGLRLMGTDG